MDNMNGVTGMMLLLYSCVLNYLFGFDANLLVLGFILITSFLLFNFPKARIFLGDQGSQFVGFLTSAAFSLVLVKKSPALFFDYNPKDFLLVFSILVCFYAIYIYDTFYVIFIRLKNKKSIFHGDKNHVSHRLYRHGLSIGQVPFAIVALQIPFCLMGFWLFFKL
jgi:UDP-N-acetylmuramyl pentapeptide phosphotransferase/UDP-N-acetylglucosamine-1-phosphate transferase